MKNILLGMVLCAVVGCGNSAGVELKHVTGQVTLDGKPLMDAKVVFFPEKGRPSIGKTDEDGQYVLIYMDGINGVLPGKHKVNISTLVVPDSDSDDPEIMRGHKEEVPPIYNAQSTLIADVDENKEIDFDLKTR